MPSSFRMTSPENPLRENHVDDEKQHDACIDEDVCCYRYSNVCRPSSPDDTHDHGGDSSHAETKHHA